MTAAQVTENDADKWRLRKNFPWGEYASFLTCTKSTYSEVAAEGQIL